MTVGCERIGCSSCDSVVRVTLVTGALRTLKSCASSLGFIKLIQRSFIMNLQTLSIARRRVLFALAAFALAAMALVQPFAASAHETREVATDYSFVVGFIGEPAIQGDTNGIWLEVTSAEAPVPGLADTLQAQVIFGEETRDMTLTPAFGEDGVYEAVFIPTAPGDYTFRFFGQVNGVDVDETFTSSPEGFDAVRARSELEFPGTGEVGTGDNTTSVAMPLAAGAVVLLIGLAGFAVRRRRA